MKTLLVLFTLVTVACGQSVQGSAPISGGFTTSSTSVTPPPTPDENLYCSAGDIWTGPANDGAAALPMSCVYTALSGTPSPGSTTNAADSTAFTNALTSVSCGDTITLNAGSVYTGPFTLPDKTCDATHWITIRTTGTTDPLFPAEGTRATPCEIGLGTVAAYPHYTCVSAGSRMAVVQAPANSQSNAIIAAAGADHYRLIGLDIRKNPGSTKLIRKLVDLSAGADHIIIDRSLIRGEAWASNANGESQGGVNANNSTYIAVINSWIYDTYCMSTCTDSQGYAAGVGTVADGPHKLYNNLIASAGESWIWGGGGNFPSPTPGGHDIEIRHNHSFKPLTWMLEVAGDGTSSAIHPQPKNLGELKNGNRALFESNVLENSWAGWQGDQTGNAMVIGPKNQNNHIVVTASFSGATATAATAVFQQTMVSAPNPGSCSPPGVAPNYCGCPVDPADGVRRCIYEIADSTRTDDNTQYRIASVSADLKSVTLTQVPTDTTHVTNIIANACPPGDAPDAFVKNVVLRYNWTRNTTNGFQIFTGVSSHCNDEANGMDTIVAHDNLFDGLEDTMSNGNGPNIQSRAFDVGNSVYGSPLHDLYVQHNTCTILHAGSGSISGLMKDGDGTNVSILRNFTIKDNVCSGGIIGVQGSGTRMNPSPLAGLNQHHCVTHSNTYSAGGTVPAGSLPDPNLTGNPPEVNCTWAVQENIVGTSQWTGQQDQTPANYPASNQTCGLASASCFLSGASYGSLFTAFNAGYLGNYVLANASYQGQGTDGADPGAAITTMLTKQTGVAPLPTPGILNITTISLPTGTVGTAYTLSTIATNQVNSPFAACTISTGTLPTGLTLSRGCRLGWLGLTNLSRVSGVVTLAMPEDLASGSFVAGQAVTISGLVNGSGAAANDASVNGNFVVTSVSAAGNLTFSQAGADITSHALNYVGPTARFAPTAPGVSSFTISARDGAKQTDTQALTLTVNAATHTVALNWGTSQTGGVTYRVYRTTTSGSYTTPLVTGLTTTTYTDSTVSNATTYYYIVRSYDNANESTNSNEATANVP